MDLSIVDLIENYSNEADNVVFLNNIDSKLSMSLNKKEIIENDEWIDDVMATLPYIEQICEQPNKIIKVEEEVVKMELIKKVTVDSIKHLSKHPNLVSQFDKESGDVTPERMLNIFREENFVTYENKFIYTLIQLINNFVRIREKNKERDENTDFRNSREAKYEAKAKIGKERLEFKTEILCHDLEKVKMNTAETDNKMRQMKRMLNSIMNTELYQIVDSAPDNMISPPLKMTNVLLKSVKYTYCVTLWNYLNEHIDLRNKNISTNKDFKDDDKLTKLFDELCMMNFQVLNYATEGDKIKENKDKTEMDEKVKRQLTKKLINSLIILNPDMPREELNKMIVNRYLEIKKNNDISSKAVEDRFMNCINNYINNAKKMRL